jgi:hypothetical protein
MSLIRVVDLAGSPGDIGFQHGLAASEQIHAHLERWRGQVRDRRIEALLEIDNFVDAARRLTPWLVAEVAGLAEGAGLSHAESWLLQLMDETWMQAGLRSGQGCTSFAAVEGMRSWIGQTMDLEGFRDGSQLVLRIRPEAGAAQLVITMAGCVGLFGVSAAGFAICVNALPQTPASTDGLPVAFVFRAALAQPHFEAAVEFLRDAPHATGQHYVVASEREVASLECSSVGVVNVMPGAKRVWHTNHPLVGYVTTDHDTTDHDTESESRWLAVRPAMTRFGFDRRRARELLESPPVWRPQAGCEATFTFCSALIEQSASRAPELWVHGAAPAALDWQPVSWIT